MRATVRSDGTDVELEYAVAGDGPELVWLHGLTGSLDESRPVAERLAQHYRVLWYSTRGHGRSTPVMERRRYTYDVIADDLASLLDHVGFDRPTLAGGSHGANTILRHELRHPGRARALVLIAPGANALRRPPRLHWWLVRAHTMLAERRGQDAVIKAISGYDPQALPTEPGLASEAAAVVAAARTHDFASLSKAMRHIADQQVIAPENLTDFRVPTAVAAWPDDPLIHPIAVGRRIAELIPGAVFEQVVKPAGLAPSAIADLAADVVHRYAEALA